MRLLLHLILLFSSINLYSQWLIHPDTLLCAKWKSDNLESSGSDAAVSPEYEYASLSRREAVIALKDNNIKAVILRYNERSRIIEGIKNVWSQNDFDTATVKLIKTIKLYSPDTRVYLWKRQWFNRNSEQVSDFADVMAGIINMAKEEDCDDTIAGLCPIETNLDNSSQSLLKAVEVAKAINVRINN